MSCAQKNRHPLRGNHEKRPTHRISAEPGRCAIERAFIVLDVDSEANVPLVRSSDARERWGKWDWPLVTSSLSERAILELLDEVPERETFHQADMLFEGLRNLSPRKLQLLLHTCRSVNEEAVPVVRGAAPAAVAQCARPRCDRPGERQANARQGRQARPEIQYHGAGVARWRSLKGIGSR